MKRKLKSDMEQVSRFSEAEIARRAASDPDALPTDETFWMRAVWAEHPAANPSATVALPDDPDCL
jgi:hypothetical protein